MSDSREFSDRKRARVAPEKSNFVHTCNLLSQFIKEKGSLKDLNLEIGGKVESLESIVKADKSQAAAASAGINSSTNKEKSVPESTEQDANKSVTREGAQGECKSSQLTIFYGGRVLVFDDFPAEKAKELVEFAGKESSNEFQGTLSRPGGVVASTSTAQELLPPRPDSAASLKAKRILLDSAKGAAAAVPKQDLVPPRLEPSGSFKAKGILLNSGAENTRIAGASASAGAGAAVSDSRPQQQLPPQLETTGSDLPIARRSSLHRFLAKRKDRNVREQNQNQEMQPACSSKSDEQALELKL